MNKIPYYLWISFPIWLIGFIPSCIINLIVLPFLIGIVEGCKEAKEIFEKARS